MYGELVTIDGELFVKSSLDCHIDSPLKKVLRGYETFNGDYYFITEEPLLPHLDAFGLHQHAYGWEWSYIYENSFKKEYPRIWPIKKSDLPYAGKRGDYN